MAIEVNGKFYRTLADEFFLDHDCTIKVYKALVNGVQVYPEDALPVRIEVVVPPNKTRYRDGETMDYTGIVVKAYYESGAEYGTVPFEELKFPISVFHQGDTWYEVIDVELIELPEYLDQPLNAVSSFSAPFTSYDEWKQEYVTGVVDYSIDKGGLLLPMKRVDGLYEVYGFSKDADSIITTTRTASDPFYDFVFTTGVSDDTYKTLKSHTDFHYQSITTWGGEPGTSLNPLKVDIAGQSFSTRALQEFGTVLFDGDCYTNAIPVLWDRPVDEKTLSTQFEVESDA